LKEFDELDLMKTFVKQLIASLRDESADIKALIKKSQAKTKEHLGMDFFPFTEESVEMIFQMSRTSGMIKLLLPRDIQKVMTDSLGDAMIQNKPFIDTEIVSKIMTT
jgi:phenylalanyl-tRNA synthetase alpha subunit